MKRDPNVNFKDFKAQTTVEYSDDSESSETFFSSEAHFFKK